MDGCIPILFIYIFWKALNIAAIVTQSRMGVGGGLGREENGRTTPLMIISLLRWRLSSFIIHPIKE